jgi:hypothetical protein
VRIKDNIFGSRPERNLYKALEGSWPDKLKVYPGLPFLSVIDWSGARLTAAERDFLKKTSIDYTACDAATDHPLISVDFDGMGRGFTRAGRYHEVVSGQDYPFREQHFNLKVRMANAVRYPLMVVSYDEASPIGGEDQLTVTHGLIGSYLTHFFTQRRLEEIGPTLDWDGLSEAEIQERVDWLITDIEVDAMFEWNPLVVKAAKARTEAQAAGMKRWDFEYLTDPPTSEASASVSLRDSMLAFYASNRLGARVTVRGDRFLVSKEIWLRNIEDAATSAALAESIASWLAYREFVDRVSSGRRIDAVAE